MDRKARAFLLFGMAFINFFFFHSTGLRALGILWVIFGIYLLASKPRAA